MLDRNMFPVSDARLLPYLQGVKSQLTDCGFRNDSLHARANRVIGETYLKLHSPDSARAYLLEAIRINRLPGNKSAVPHNIRNYLSLASAEKMRGKPDAARIALNNCLVLAQKTEKMPPEAVNAYYLLGEIEYEARRFSECLTETGTGEIVAHNAGDVPVLVKLYLLQARAYFALNDPNNSTLAADKAHRLCLTLPAPETRSRLLNEIAELLKQQNRIPEAKDSYLMSIAFIGNQPVNSDLPANTYCKLGRLMLSQPEPDYTKARFYFRKALETSVLYTRKAEAAQLLADACSAAGNRQQALHFYQIAIESLVTEFCPKNVTDNPGLIQTRTIAEKLQLYSAVVGKANVWLDSIRTTAEKPGLRSDLTDKALQTYLLADSLASLIAWHNESRLISLAWEQTTREHYQNALETCYLGKRNDQALHFIEKYRALLLKDKLGLPEKLSGEGGIVPSHYRQLNQEIKQYRTLVQTADQYEDHQAFSKKLRQLIDTRSRLARELVLESPYYAAQLNDSDIPDLAVLRKEVIAPLGPTGAYLAYFEGPKNSFGLLVTGHTLSLRKFSTAHFQKLASEYADLLARPGTMASGRFLKVSGALYRLMVAPFAISPLNRLIVSPAGALLPLEALSRSETSPDFLVRTHAFSYTYSAAQLYVASRPKGPFPFHRNFLGMSPELFSYNNGNKRVVNVSETLKALGSKFFLPTVYTGSGATADKFLKEAPGFKVVQLFARYGFEGPEPTIAFSDSALPLSALRDTKFRTQLLVLPEAPEQNGEYPQPDAAFGISRELTAFGVASVITTLWKGNRDLSLARLEAFYQHVLEGRPLDMALRQTKAEWLQKHPQTPPGEWAGMVLTGNAARVSTDKEVYLGLAAGIVLFLITLYTTFVVQKKRRRRPSEDTQES
ncbi:hypothetical protein GCM10023091_13490 [Ravibacter arvi]|uniref:CHAT domain-containing protein n=2 Tax=Ravibacter arvi TaxID=2051041 RepID=A0ABP8LTU1_9BACT